MRTTAPLNMWIQACCIALASYACSAPVERVALKSTELLLPAVQSANWVLERDGEEPFVVSASLAEDASELIATSGRPPERGRLPITLQNEAGDTLTISVGADGKYHYAGSMAVSVEPQHALSCTFCTCMNQGGGVSLCESGSDSNNCHQVDSTSCYSVACIGGGGGHRPPADDFKANGDTQLLVQAKFHAER